MGKKKKSGVERGRSDWWCWYCDREFVDLSILVQHQKSKHFKCKSCGKRMTSLHGMRVHCEHVHKIKLDKVPNSIPGRESIEVEVFGMDGIPTSMNPDYGSMASNIRYNPYGGVSQYNYGGYSQQPPGYIQSGPGGYGIPQQPYPMHPMQQQHNYSQNQTLPGYGSMSAPIPPPAMSYSQVQPPPIPSSQPSYPQVQPPPPIPISQPSYPQVQPPPPIPISQPSYPQVQPPPPIPSSQPSYPQVQRQPQPPPILSQPGNESKPRFVPVPVSDVLTKKPLKDIEKSVKDKIDKLSSPLPTKIGLVFDNEESSMEELRALKYKTKTKIK